MNNYFIKNFILKSPLYTYLLYFQHNQKPLYKISKRFYPGKEIGHAMKLLNASAKKIANIPEVPAKPLVVSAVASMELDDISQNVKHDNNPPASAVKSKLPIYFYDSAKVENQMKSNWSLKKYLPYYEK